MTSMSWLSLLPATRTTSRLKMTRMSLLSLLSFLVLSAARTTSRLKMTRMSWLSLLSFLVLSAARTTSGLKMTASFSQHGVKGEIVFETSDSGSEDSVRITADLTVAEGSEGEYKWGVYEFPIDYSKEDYCHSRFLGRRPKVNLENIVGQLVLPSDGPVSDETPDLTLTGRDGIWGKSLVLEGPARQRICSTIVPEEAAVRVAEARFTTPVAGSVFFHTLTVGGGGATETKIFTNLYHVVDGKDSNHPWQIFITDILGTNKQRESCNFLQILYDPYNRSDEDCSESNPSDCKEGDLTAKFGAVRVGKKESMFTKKHFSDLTLSLPAALSGGARSLYLALYAPDSDDYYACARIQEIRPRVATATFMHDGITGHVAFTQTSPFHPVRADVQLAGLHDGAGSYHIHKFPIPAKLNGQDATCGNTGPHYNPFNVDKSSSPVGGAGTSDQYEVGDLSGKYGDLKDKTRMSVSLVDNGMTLYGPLSVIGRSIVIHKSPVPHRWVCANIELEGAQMMTAVAEFVYPISGRIVFRQELDNPLADTSVYVEGLLYSDGSKNDTRDHRWHVHTLVPGKDFFNWTGRCLSAGSHFNPYKINTEERIYRQCSEEHVQERCEVGDLHHKTEALEVVGRKRELASTKRFFTDSNLPLAGLASIVGRSIVLHDDHAPEHRGDRMACTAIRRLYRHKAVASQWFGNGIPPPVDGRLVFVQDTAMSMTQTLVDLNGLERFANSYHVHLISVQPHLEFPCTGNAVGGHYNPWKLDKSDSPLAASGTPDQYEIGDLSGKYGMLENKLEVREKHNDTNLPLFGANSIMGRSIVIHKKERAERWACSSIGWGYDPDEASQVTAIASFHHPNGFAWGYIRFSQVVYKDGSTTDTNINVRLKYPGKNNNDRSSGHDWSVYVNTVHHDAAVKFEGARCSAAGYRWNPTHIQLANPRDHGFYSEECGPDTPLRCQVGDLSGRHGRINLGGESAVFNDGNLPLSGDWFNSAIGKSIVIHGPDGAGHSMACANIKPDKDIVKYAVIKTLAGFNLAVFVEEVQAVMGVPEWFLFIDSRETKILHEGRCLQILVHFRGPEATKLEQDFARLLRTGRLTTPSLFIPGYVPAADRKTKLGYRECGSALEINREIYGLSPYGSGGGSRGWDGLAVLVPALLALAAIVFL